MTPTDSADAATTETAPVNPAIGETPPPPVHTIDVGGTATDNSAGVPLAEQATVAPAAPAAPKEQPSSTLEAEGVPPEPSRPGPPATILAVDIGGTKVKILATGQTEPRKAPTGKEFTPALLVDAVRALAAGWEYEAISIGYPGLVGTQGPRSEPGNLGAGWVGFDFAAAFGKPVKMINDAAMQALGSYEGGRMLFLGLGTGLGSALITGHVIVPLELGHLPHDGDRRLGDVLGRRGLEQLGKGVWREEVNKSVTALMRAFVADYVVIGGGNAKNVKDLPPGARLGHNLTAFRGGFRMWSVDDVWVLAVSGGESPQPAAQEEIRML